jgi:AbrB family looped-hinge helix DNA binding protein
MQMAKVTAKGQITVPIDVRRRLGLNEGSRMLFIERDNGFFVVNANCVDFNVISGAKAEINANSWSDDLIGTIMAFDDIPDFVEHDARN